MSLSDRTRGQAEPNVALIAVAFLVIALGVFAGYHQGVSQESADRTVANPALNTVYSSVTDMGEFDKTAELSELLAPPDLPRGHSIYVTVTYLDIETGTVETVARAYFDEDGHHMGSQIDGGLPDDVQNASRPIAISPPEGDSYSPDGDDHGGRLTVSVWKNQ